jgi:hypothetical protein
MKKPFTYALFAVAYIMIIVTGLHLTSSIEIPEQTIIVPMAMLSLLVLSAALMGFLFASEPILLYMENKKKEAVSFFFKTIGFFAGFVVILFALALCILFWGN